MKPAPPVTKMVCRINISLPQGDQHAGMPRCCHLPGKRSIVIKKDGLSPSTPRSSISCLAGFYLSRPPLVRGSGIHHTPAWFLRRFCHSFPAHRIKINLLNIRSHLGPKILFADYGFAMRKPIIPARSAALPRSNVNPTSFTNSRFGDVTGQHAEVQCPWRPAALARGLPDRMAERRALGLVSSSTRVELVFYAVSHGDPRP